MRASMLPITIVVLFVLFATQRFGTDRVGKAFGPIIVLWFLALAAIGVHGINGNPEVLKALNPWWGVRFFLEHGWHGIFILGAVVLAVTGGGAIACSASCIAMPRRRRISSGFRLRSWSNWAHRLRSERH
jgi:KUP system potassium uptake protein